MLLLGRYPSQPSKPPHSGSQGRTVGAKGASRIASLTHTLTHTGKGLKSAGREVCASSPAFFSALYHLCHEAARRLGCFVLLLPGGVDIGAEGKPGNIVAQHRRHSFHIDAILQGRGSKGVA